jgi:hypothetical protein
MARSVEEQTGVDPGSLEVEAPQEPTPETERPEWLDERFASVEDQAKAYAESEKKMTQTQQQYRDIERRLDALAEQQQTEQAQQTHPQPFEGIQAQAPLVQQYQEAVETGDVMTQLGIQALLAQQAAEQAMSKAQPPQQEIDQQAQVFAHLAEQETANRFGEEWEALKPEVGQLLSEHPHLLPDTGDLAQTVNALSMVAEMVKARQSTGVQAAQDAGRQQKLLAQGMSGSAGRPDTQQVSAAEHLKSLMQNVR